MFRFQSSALINYLHWTSTSAAAKFAATYWLDLPLSSNQSPLTENILRVASYRCSSLYPLLDLSLLAAF
jgi:hypothetical protein